MTHDQADELRQLVRSRGRYSPPADARPRLLAVTGGQRGVGASTVAMNLAAAYALEGRRTVLVDADLERGDLAQRLGATERGTLVDILNGRYSIHEVLARGPAGMLLVPGTWAPQEAQDCPASAQGRLIAQLQRLGGHADVVIIDTGAARGSFVRRFWQAADVPLVVTAPHSAAIMDAYATIKVLLAGDTSQSVHTFVTQADGVQQAAEVHARIAAACRRFLGLRVSAAGQTEADSEAANPAPYVLRSPASALAQAVEQAAAQLWLGSAPATGPTEKPSAHRVA